MLKQFEKMLNGLGRTEMPKVLFAAAECAPLSKTGGLADVVGTLPKTLANLGSDARVITPYHRVIKNKFGSQVKHLFDFFIDLGWRHQYAGIELLELSGVTIYLVDSEYYFGGDIYRGGYGEGEQYAFFSRAVLEAMPRLGFEPDIVHCNDWHTAMIPMLAKTQYQGRMQSKCRYLLSIHNIAYQGKYDFGFVRDLFSIPDMYYSPDYIELYGCASFMKAGCVFADKISTVSPNYAQEIRMPYYSEGLDGVLEYRAGDLSGILNGIDTTVFNPAKDKLIPARYSAADLSGKAECKRALQEKLGLEQNADVPLISMVTRMTEQKGFELVLAVLDELMQTTDCQFVLLGTGDARYENFMRGAEYRYKGRLASYIGYSEELSHLVYAGSDFFLMPSRFEPCGLSQMMSMRYGTLPIVRETGGLKDSVVPYNCITGEGTGFSFANFNANEMLDTIRRAFDCYRNEAVMAGLISNAMAADFSFRRSAKEYEKLYISMLK